MKNILIIGCGLIGSSLLRSISEKKLAKKIFVYEKSKKYIKDIKRLKLSCEIIKNFDEYKDYYSQILYHALREMISEKYLLKSKLNILKNFIY